MKRNKLSPIQKLAQDDGIPLTLPIDSFNLRCCHCHLRHHVYIEQIAKKKVRIYLVVDDWGTDAGRRIEALENQVKRLKKKRA